MDKAIAVIRVSTNQQADEGVSLAAQEKAVRTYCEFRGLDLVDVVIEAGVSGSKPMAKRKGGRKVLAAIKSGEVQAVVAYKLDRLFRNTVDCLTNIESWESQGVALHLLDMGGQAVDTSSPMGKFMLSVMAAAAQMERDQVKARTQFAIDEKKSRGEKTGGKLPYGWRLAADGVTLEPDPSEQIVLQRLKSLRSRGWTYPQIRDEFNKIFPKKARGSKWHVTSLRRAVARAA